MLNDISWEYIPAWLSISYLLSVWYLFAYGTIYIVKYNANWKENNRKVISFLCFFIVFAIFYCVDTDYLNYKFIVETASKWVSNVGSSTEILYQRLAYWCNGNYELFRLIVWGAAIIIFSVCARRFGTSVYLALLMLFLLYYNYFCYARASLAMSVFFLGVCILVTSRKRWWKIAGIAVMVFSLAFHRSMLIPLSISPLMFIDITKKNYFQYFILIFVLLFLAINSIGDIVTLLDNEQYTYKLIHYESEISEGRYYNSKNWKGFIRAYLGYFSFYIGFIIVSVPMLSKKYSQSIAVPIKKLYRITFGIIIISLCSYLAYGLNNVFFYRILFTSQIPISIMIAYMLYEGIPIKRGLYILLAVAFLNHSMALIHTVLERSFGI
ncbi:MAG: EpsG family protein [Bacteroidales bacterium]|nr:EpsG family protein [Bacteroidales bacterium]